MKVELSIYFSSVYHSLYTDVEGPRCCGATEWSVSLVWKFQSEHFCNHCLEPGCEKRELSDTECSCGNDMPIKKQVYPEVYPF